MHSKIPPRLKYDDWLLSAWRTTAGESKEAIPWCRELECEGELMRQGVSLRDEGPQIPSEGNLAPLLTYARPQYRRRVENGQRLDEKALLMPSDAVVPIPVMNFRSSSRDCRVQLPRRDCLL